MGIGLAAHAWSFEELVTMADEYECARREQIFEDVFGIAPGIDDDNALATAEDHFVEPEVFEMPAIGKIHILVPLVGISNRFGKQWPDSISGP